MWRCSKMSETNLNKTNNCYKCGEVITSSTDMQINGNNYCTACYSDEIVSADSFNNSTNSTSITNQPYENKYSKPLGILAYIQLISSIIGSIYIWSEYGTIELSMGNFFTYTEKVVNPVGIGLGFGVLFQGIVFFILLSALKVMSEDIAQLRNN